MVNTWINSRQREVRDLRKRPQTKHHTGPHFLMQELEPRVLLSAATTTPNPSLAAPPVATALVFLQQPPATTVAGANLKHAIKVEVVDQSGNVLVADHSTITLTAFSLVATPGLTPGQAPRAVNSAPMSAKVKNGIATFSKISAVVAGDEILGASNGLVPSAVSNTFTVTPAKAKRLFVEFLPTTTVPHDTYGFEVVVQDKYNNIVTTNHSAITIKLISRPNNTKPYRVVVRAINGIATFTISFTRAGHYRLRVTAAGLPTVKPPRLTFS